MCRVVGASRDIDKIIGFSCPGECIYEAKGLAWRYVLVEVSIDYLHLALQIPNHLRDIQLVPIGGLSPVSVW